MGEHRGLHLYTLGQRKGHGVASPREGMAYVVVAKDIESNRLVVGWDESDTPGLYTAECVIGSVSTLGVNFACAALAGGATALPGEGGAGADHTRRGW